MSSNQNLHSMTKLTEFARDFEEEPETLFGRFVNKIQNAYNQSYNTVNDLSSVNPQSPTPSTTSNNTKSVFYADVSGQPDNTNITRDSSSSSLNSNAVYQTKLNAGGGGGGGGSGDTSSNTADDSSSVGKVDTLPMEAHEGRTMVNVLKRMRSMMASKNNVRSLFW